MPTVDLHAIIKKDALPVLGFRAPEQMSYRMAQLASHKSSGDRQVYVWAADQSGLQEFRQDFPDADIRPNGKFRGDRREWFIEMFPAEDDGVRDAHEIFFAGVQMVIRNDAERKARRDREKEAEDRRKEIRNEPRTVAVTTAAEPVVATTPGGKKDK